MKKSICVFLMFVFIFGCSTTCKYSYVPEEKYGKTKVLGFYYKNEDGFKKGLNEGDQLMDVLFSKFSINVKLKTIDIEGIIQTSIGAKESISNVVLYLGIKKDDTFTIDKIIGSTDINGFFNVTFKYNENTVLIFYFVSFIPIIYDIGKFEYPFQ